MSRFFHRNTSTVENDRTPFRSRRRGGVVVVYFALGLTLFIGCAALVLDLGFRYQRRAEAQRAADAAALAAVTSLINPTAADAWAKNIAALNGYNVNDPAQVANGVSVVTTFAPGGNQTRLKVSVSRLEPVFFGSFFNRNRPRIGANATAECLTFADININGGGAYGVNGAVTLSLFGPDSYYNYGDPFSTTNLSTGAANPQNQGWKGYDFTFEVPSNYRSQYGTHNVTLEVFDPDCYNAGGEVNANRTTTVDEYRTSSGGNGSISNATTTQYQLFWDPNTPNNLGDDILVDGTQTIGADSTFDMKWNNMFQWDRRTYTGPGRYRLNVKSTAGASENGFNLRAGPPHSTSMTEATWSSTYGNKTAAPVITASGNLPMNFNENDTSATVTLGAIPTEARGGAVFINKFDTDVQAKSVVYTCTSLPGESWEGDLSSDGQWKLDTIPLPSTYTTGIWKATYAAGAGDTSVWQMSYKNFVPGKPGRLRLVD